MRPTGSGRNRKPHKARTQWHIFKWSSHLFLSSGIHHSNKNLTQNSMYREMNGWRSGQRTNMLRLPWILTSSSRGISKGSGGHSEPMIQSEELRSRHMKCLPQNPMPRSRRLHPPPPVSVHVGDGWPQKPRTSRLTAIYPRTAPPTPQV